MAVYRHIHIDYWQDGFVLDLTPDKLIDRFVSYKKIVYCDETKELFLVNWMKHNKPNGPKVKRCIEKELSNVKSKELIDLFFRVCKRYGYSMDRVSIPMSIVENNLQDHYGEKEKEKQKEK